MLQPTKQQKTSSNVVPPSDDFDNPYVRIAYLCKICGKEQSKKFKFDWKRHYNTHGTTPKPHVCDVCGKSYAQKGFLNKHMKTHGGDVNYSNSNNISVGNASLPSFSNGYQGKMETDIILD